ncbi:MAG: M1 family metallopeptidase, partial [Acidobacteriaceae bacterium]|nr:M1 family metallopeptidase [Acidobacteriaceae bacterium]
MLSRTLPACLLFAVAGFAAKGPEPPKLRLGDAVIPSRYAIDLTIVPDHDDFKGSAAIEVSVKQPENIIWLNATRLEVQSVAFEQGGRSEAGTVVPGGEQFVGVSFGREISGNGTLRFEYTGKISRNSSAGLFELKDGDRWYVYSQFEPTDARRAFPSFDEPSFKTPYQMTLHVPQHDMALANTPSVGETKDADGMKTVRFAETKPLPSYLVALAVGPFDAVSAGKVGKTPLRVIVPHGRGSEAKFAVEAIPQLLKLLENYFGTPYPYEKLDSVVMPISNFAMENVGLITYGQSLLLSKPENDSYSRKKTCAVVVAHEMSHQWFGDSVTTAWWNDIWLNEAFATWMENKMVAEWKPEWNIDVTQVESRLGAMGIDSLVSSRKIRQPIASNDDIANAFDGITYEKGAAVIEMFEHWIGSDTFRQGVRQYIRQHANGNATTADFEAAISKAAGKNITPAFDSFLDQAGIPLLTASLECGGAHPALKISQKRSLPLGSPGASPQTWQVPVCVKYGADGKAYSECELMTDPRTSIELKHAKACPDWILPNDGEVGYYRVAYEGELLDQLLGKNADKLSTAEKVGVLGDVRALVSSAQISPKQALALVPELRNDSHRQVVESVLSIAELTTSRSVPQD